MTRSSRAIRSETEPPHLAADTWTDICTQAVAAIGRDPYLSGPLSETLLCHTTFADALAHQLARKLGTWEMPAPLLVDLIVTAQAQEPGMVEAAITDLRAVRERDPACPDLLTPLLYFKGYQSLQIHRVGHWLWRHDRTHLARYLQSRMSEVFAVDIHPAARLGCGILLDHGTGIVIGETAVVDDHVSILQNVTLGGVGDQSGDRHPKVRQGALIGAGATVLGNIEIGQNAKVGAGSIVLHDVRPFTTVVGVPARPVGNGRITSYG